MLESAEFWVLIAFVVFVALVYRKVARLLGTTLDERSLQIRNRIEEAVKLREEAQATLAGYQRRQREAQKEAEEIVSLAKSDAARLREQAQKDLNHALERREQAAMDKIAQAEARAVKEVRDQAIALALSATTRVLGERLPDDKANKLIDDALAEMPGKLH